MDAGLHSWKESGIWLYGVALIVSCCVLRVGSACDGRLSDSLAKSWRATS